jgi:hypothetical protein
MKEDLLHDDFSKNVDLEKIGKNIKNIYIMTTIGSIYCILDIIRWLKTYYSASLSVATTQNFTTFIVFNTSFSILMFALVFTSWIYYLKGNILLKKSFELDDSQIFNQAYKIISRTTVILIVANIMNLISLIASFFL